MGYLEKKLNDSPVEAVHSGPDLNKLSLNLTSFFQGFNFKIQFREMVKFDEESDFEQKKMNILIFLAQIGFF
jgi:hypothetical protein